MNLALRLIPPLSSNLLSLISPFLISLHQNVPFSTHSLQPQHSPIITSICNCLRKRENWETLTQKFQSFHFTTPIIQEILLHLKEPKDAKNALNFFHWSAKNCKIQHGVFIYCIIIHILAKSKLVKHANALIESLLKKEENVFVGLDSLIGSYKLVDSCPFVFDLFVQCCGKLRMIDNVLDVCKRLDENGFMLSVITYNTLLHVVDKSDKSCMVWGLYEYMIEKRVYPNEMTTRIMISGLCKEGRLGRFLDVVEKCDGKRSRPGVVVNTCLIYGMIEEGRIEDGLRLMKRMLQKNMIVDTISCSLIVLAKVRMKDLESAWGVYDEMIRRGFEGNAVVYDSFIGAYCEEMRVDEAIKLMDEMECLNMKPFGETFDHLIKVCSEVGRLEESLKLCDKMIGNGLLPSCLAFNKVVAKLSENGSAKCADKLLTTLMDKGFVPDQNIYAYLIAGYVNVGDVEGALKLYYEMQYRSISPSTCIFDSLIIALCQCGRLKEADEFLSLMIGQSLTPNILVYKKLTASHLERGDEARAHQLYRRTFRD